MSLLDGRPSIYERWSEHYFTCNVCQVGATPDQDRFCDESEPLRREVADEGMKALHRSVTLGER